MRRKGWRTSQALCRLIPPGTYQRTGDVDQEVTLLGNLYPRDETLDMFLNRPTRTISFQLNLTANPRDISSADVARIRKHLLNKQFTDPAANNVKDYDDDGSVLETADLFKDDGVTPWDGSGAIQRRDKYT